MYMISACLTGENCKYNGGNNVCPWVLEFTGRHSCLLICPEQEGGLPTPRPPAEIIGGRVVDQKGKDVTAQFEQGAREVLKKARKEAEKLGEEIEGAVLKAYSPSCGCGEIYDGTFTGRRIPGDGLTARLLKENGIHIITEKEKIE